MDRGGGIGLDERQPRGAEGDEKIDLEALLIPEVVEFAAPPGAGLDLDDLGRDEALEQRTKEGRPAENRRRIDPEEVTHNARIDEVQLGGFD